MAANTRLGSCESENRSPLIGERDYCGRKFRHWIDRHLWIRFGWLHHIRHRLRCFVLAGIAIGVFTFGGIAVGILLAIGGLVISLEFAFCGWELSVRETFNNFF